MLNFERILSNWVVEFIKILPKYKYMSSATYGHNYESCSINTKPFLYAIFKHF